MLDSNHAQHCTSADGGGGGGGQSFGGEDRFFKSPGPMASPWSAKPGRGTAMHALRGTTGDCGADLTSAAWSSSGIAASSSASLFLTRHKERFATRANLQFESPNNNDDNNNNNNNNIARILISVIFCEVTLSAVFLCRSICTLLSFVCLLPCTET